MELLIFPVMIFAIYFMFMRPQQNRAKAQAMMLSQLEIGDDVVTESGLYGTVSDLDGDTAFLLVADGVEVKVSKASISSLVVYGDELVDEE
jgi:preprotein translocase subunit YajC